MPVQLTWADDALMDTRSISRQRPWFSPRAGDQMPDLVGKFRKLHRRLVIVG